MEQELEVGAFAPEPSSSFGRVLLQILNSQLTAVTNMKRGLEYTPQKPTQIGCILMTSRPVQRDRRKPAKSSLEFSFMIGLLKSWGAVPPPPPP